MASASVVPTLRKIPKGGAARAPASDSKRLCISQEFKEYVGRVFESRSQHPITSSKFGTRLDVNDFVPIRDYANYSVQYVLFEIIAEGWI